ncbi:hypothetical protein [Streptomyces sp. RK75]|uniref:hypothetical protein n=1 Tax=Streptomyces sp. RK75 TaxID=2824895 RepID=UPI001B39B0FA|nr:hypothetical protein [Streptomyces sp. RK75]MBQ0863064.1 hypothetical protein [Streptomyces sp. RK75]
MQMTLFRQLVHERGWTTVETFAVHFARAARELAEEAKEPRLASVSVARRSLDRWVAGNLKTMPQRDTRRVLEHLFQIPAARLFAPLDGESSADSSLRPQDSVGPPAPKALPSAPPHQGFDSPFEVATQAQTLARSNADSALLAQVQASLDSIVGRYEALGPQHLVGETRLLRTMLHTLLGGQQPPRVRAELFGLAGRASGLLAYMAVNAGAGLQVAEAYCGETETLAREIGDTRLQMWAAGTRSLGLYYHRHYADADAAAAAGIALAPNSGQAIRLLANGRARAQARLGDRSGAEKSIGRALELSDRQPSLPAGLTPCIAFTEYSPARTLANVITARLSLNDTRDVLSCAEEIEGLVEQSDSEWSRALVRLDVATALLQQQRPEVEHSMELGRSALRAGTTAPIKSVWQRANELYERAQRWHTESAVGDYADELRAWRSKPQAELVVSGPGGASVPEK